MDINNKASTENMASQIAGGAVIKTGWSALHHASRNGQLAEVKKLAEAGGDPNILDVNGRSALWHASGWDGSSAMIEFLLKWGANVNFQTPDGSTVLHREAWCGNSDSVAILLQAGADPNIADLGGSTPLHKAAAWRGYDSIVQLLLQYGALVDATRNDGQTPLHVAVKNGGCFGICIILLEARASPAILDCNDNTPLDIALASGVSTRVVNALGSFAPRGTSLLSAEVDNNATNSIVEEIKTPNEEGKECENPNLLHTNTLEIEAENRAFQASVAKFESASQPNQEDTSLRIRPPKRLINIYNGRLEEGTPDKKFVIASYIWYPEAVGSMNYDPIKREKLELMSGDFGSVLSMACSSRPDVISISDTAVENVGAFHSPSFVGFEGRKAYLEEVFILTAREAYTRGIQYVWMDSICIDQSDEEDIKDQVSRMSDYYAGAECCLVVAEILRRRLSFRLDSLSVDEHILAWVIGYHSTRLWVFQETYLPSHVICRAGNIRIDATRMLHIELPDDRFLSVESDIVRAQEYFPISTSVTYTRQQFTLTLCLELLKQRACARMHDRIYGVLALFPRAVQRSLTVDYKLSVSAIFAIFVYLRIRSGELNALCTLRSSESPRHSILIAPSWIPTGHGHNYDDVMNIESNHDLNPDITAAELDLTMPFLWVADVHDLSSTTTTLEVGSGNPYVIYADTRANIVFRLMDDQKILLPKLYGGCIEPVDTVHISEQDLAYNDVALSSDNLRAVQEQRIERTRLQIAARQDRAVLAWFGCKKDVRQGMFRPRLIGMLLSTDGSGSTWRRHGLAHITEYDFRGINVEKKR
jgi:hypothetical protein